jgi:hypothetical protein
MIIKDFVQYMASLGNTPKQIKMVLNKFLSRRKSPKLKVCLIVLIIVIKRIYISKLLGNKKNVFF